MVLTSTHRLCFGPKNKKKGIPQFCYIKVWNKGVYYTWTCQFPDVFFSPPEMVQDIEEEHKNHDHGPDNRDSGSGPTVVVDVQTEENNSGTS